MRITNMNNKKTGVRYSCNTELVYSLTSTRIGERQAFGRLSHGIRCQEFNWFG